MGLEPTTTTLATWRSTTELHPHGKTAYILNLRATISSGGPSIRELATRRCGLILFLRAVARLARMRTIRRVARVRPVGGVVPFDVFEPGTALTWSELYITKEMILMIFMVSAGQFARTVLELTPGLVFGASRL
jgi:hypothetical protein